MAGLTLRHPMTSDEYRTALERLGLTQDGLDEFIGRKVPNRMANAYAADAPIPLELAMLLRLMIRHKINPGDVK